MFNQKTKRLTVACAASVIAISGLVGTATANAAPTAPTSVAVTQAVAQTASHSVLGVGSAQEQYLLDMKAIESAVKSDISNLKTFQKALLKKAKADRAGAVKQTRSIADRGARAKAKLAAKSDYVKAVANIRTSIARAIEAVPAKYDAARQEANNEYTQRRISAEMAYQKAMNEAKARVDEIVNEANEDYARTMVSIEKTHKECLVAAGSDSEAVKACALSYRKNIAETKEVYANYINNAKREYSEAVRGADLNRRAVLG